MATSLGRLTIDLAANAAGFESDMKRASKAAQREMAKVSRNLRFAQADLDKANAKLSTMATRIGAIGAVSLGLVVREFKKLGDEADRIQKVGIATRLTAEAIQELGFAAEQSGSNMEAVIKGVQQLQKNIVQANDGLATYVRAFERVGIAVEDLQGLSPEQQFLTLAEAISKVDDPTVRTATAMELLGRAGKDLIPLLAEGSDGIEELREQLRSTGSVMSQETVEAAAQFNDAMNLLTRQLSGVSRALFADLIGPLAELADFLARSEEGQKALRETLSRLGDVAKLVGGVIAGALVVSLVKAIIQVAVAETRVASLARQKLILAGASATAAARMTLFGRAVAVATGPIGIIITVLGSLALAYREVKSLSGLAGEAAQQFGQETESLSDRVKQLTGDFAGLRQEQILATKSDIAARQAEIRREFAKTREEAKQVLREQRETGFLDPALIDLRQTLDTLKAEFEDNEKASKALDKALGEIGGTTGTANSAKKNFDSLIESLNEFATEAALDAIKRAGEIAESMKAMDSEIADVAATLDGPFAVALREFQRESAEIGEAFRNNDISAEQARVRLEQLEEQFRRTSIELRDGLIDSMYEAIDSAIPSFIAGMLGIADAANEVDDAFQKAGQRIGQNISTALLNGQDLGSSIGSALTAFGQEPISEAVGNAFAEAFEGLGDNQAVQDGLAVGSLALGQAIEGNIAGAIGAGVGAALGSVIPGVGTLLGSAIGSAIGGLFGGGSVPKFQVRGTESDTAIDAGTDRLVRGVFGDIEFAFREVGEEAQAQIVTAFIEFDKTLASVIRNNGDLSAIEDALDEFGVSSRSGPGDIEGQLKLRLDAVLSTFDGFIQDFVNQAFTLEERVQRLADIFAIENQLLLGRGFGLSGDISNFVGGPGPIGGGGGGQPGIPVDPGFGGGGISPDPILRPRAEQMAAFAATIEGTGDAADVTNPILQQTLLLLDELSIGGESLQVTFARLSEVVTSLDRASGLVGNSFAETREDLVRFGADLVALFGDNAGALSGALNRVLQAAFSDEELAQETINSAKQRATDLLTALGVTVSESTFTQEGLRDLLDNLLGNLDAESTAILIEAGGAIVDVIDAMASLGEEAEELTEDLGATAEEINAFLQEVGAQALAVVAPARLEFAQLNAQLAENERRAKELGLSEQQLQIVRLSAQIQLQGFISSLSESIATLTEQLFGASDASHEAGNEIQRGIRNTRDAWLSAIDQIRDALDSQLVGSNSSLTRAEQQQEAISQFNQALAAAQAGDLDAARNLPQLFNQAIAQSAGFFGTSTDDFADIEAQLRAALESANLPVPPQSPDVQTARNTAEIERNTFDMLAQAFSLADQIGLLSSLTEQSPAEIGAQFGIPIDELIRILTGEVPDLTGDALAQYFNDLIAETNDQLNELARLENINAAQLGELETIVDILRAGAISDVPPQFAGPVSRDGGGAIGGNISFGDSEQTTLLKSIDQKLEAANADRRAGTELTVEEISILRQITQERARVDRTESTSRPSRRRLLGA